MGDAHQVQPSVGHVERVMAFGVGSSVRGLLHALGEANQDDGIAGGRLVGGAVGHDAGDGRGGHGG
jgi:hypothetical protein